MFRWDTYSNITADPYMDNMHLVCLPLALPICMFTWEELHNFYNKENYSDQFNLAVSKYIEKKVKENV